MALHAALIALLLAALSPGAGAAAAEDDWRTQVAHARRLADNDARAAYVQAQELAAALPADASPTDRALALNLLARVETYLALTDAASDHAEQALALAERHADRIGQAEAHLNIGLNAINQGRLDRMNQAVKQSVTVLQGVDRPDLLGEALLRTAVMYRRFEQYEESAAVAVQAMEIARRSGEPLAMAYALQGMAIAYEQSDRPSESLERYTQMREQARKVPSRLLEGFALGGMGSATFKLGHPLESEALSRQAVDAYREVFAPYSISFALYGLAVTVHSQGRAQEAMTLLDEALAIYNRYPNRIGKWFVLNLRSTYEEAAGRLEDAWAEARQAEAIAQDLNQPIYLKGSAARLAPLAAARGDYRLAYQYAAQANELSNQIARVTAGDRMVDLIRRNEAESQQKAIDELTRRAERQTAQLRQSELRDRWLFTLLASALLALVGAALFMTRLRRSHQRMAALNAQLQQSEQDIRSLNARLEERVEERAQEMRRRAHYLRTLLDMLPMWVWLKDTEGRYLVVNDALARACGATVQALEGRLDSDVLPAESAAEQRADDQAVMRSGQRHIEERPMGSDASPTWMALFKAPVLDDNGEVLGTVGVAQNISERKAAEAARDAAVVEAQRLARQRSQFLAQVSHELRTPLNGILGFAQLLQQDGVLTERQQRGLRIIEDSGQHLLMLINDILDLARIDAAKLELAPSPVALEALVHSVCEVVRLKAEEKGLTFKRPAEQEAGWTVQVDERRLRQVLLNLLSNAVKFTDRGGVELRLHARRLPGTFLHPGTRTGADAGTEMVALHFEVLDQGIGMTEEQRARLFQAFEQVSDRRRRAAGTGLGLAISRELVRLMGSDIQVRSEPGQGSCFGFEIRVPLLSQEAPPAALAARPGHYSGPRRTVLVADDVEDIRLFLQDFLEPLGFDVVLARDGAQALEVLDGRNVDLILLDMAMPVMDGHETLRRLRASAATASLPVIAISADATASSPARARAAGANAFISKPIDQALLRQTLGQLLGLQWQVSPGSPAPVESAGSRTPA